MSLQQTQPVGLAFDGGGTKTIAQLSQGPAARWQELGRGSSGPSNPLRVGWQQTYGQLQAAYREALGTFSHDELKSSIASVVLAVAGTGSDDARQQLTQWAEQQWPTARVLVIEDGQATLAAPSESSARMLLQHLNVVDPPPAAATEAQETELAVVALSIGTGSVAISCAPQEGLRRVGGWGAAWGDEGGGIWLGRQVIRHLMHAEDGRATSCSWTRHVAQSIGVADRFALRKWLEAHPPDAPRLGELAPLVAEGVQQQVPAAEQIQMSLLDEAADLVNAVLPRDVKRLRQSFELALGGSILQPSTGLFHVDEFCQGLDAMPQTLLMVQEPIIGGSRLALLLANDSQRPLA